MAKRSAAMLFRSESPIACADMPAPSAWACHRAGFPYTWSYLACVAYQSSILNCHIRKVQSSLWFWMIMLSGLPAP